MDSQDVPGAPDTYPELIALLDSRGARYRLIDHPPEGRTEIVSVFRGHDPRHAAKCMVLIVKLGKKTTRYVLAVIPGDARVSLAAVKALYGATYVSFASPDIAQDLARSVPGTILPIPFDPRLELIVDPALLSSPEIFFNAARLDRSLALRTDDFVAIASPRLAQILESRTIESGSRPPGAGEAVDQSLPTHPEAVMDQDNPWGTFLNVKFAPLEPFDLGELVTANSRPWYNQTLCRVNDCVVRLGVVKGEYVWHKHDSEDEFFFVVDGRLFVDVEGDRTFELDAGHGVSVPAGVRHRTRATERTVILMVEGAGVIPSGD